MIRKGKDPVGDLVVLNPCKVDDFEDILVNFHGTTPVP